MLKTNLNRVLFLIGCVFFPSVLSLLISMNMTATYDEMSHRMFDKYLSTMNMYVEMLDSRIRILEEAVDNKDIVIQQRAKLAILDTLAKISNKEKIPTPAEINRIVAQISESSKRWVVDPALILALIHAESHFYIRAVSPAGAIGLTQVMPDTATEIFREIPRPYCNLKTIECSIDTGTYYLSKMLTKFDGSVELAIAAYNAGPSHVRRVVAGQRDTYYQETEKYTRSIVDTLHPHYREQLRGTKNQ